MIYYETKEDLELMEQLLDIALKSGGLSNLNAVVSMLNEKIKPITELIPKEPE